ncbi:MAG: hypothetical protein QOJ03_594 [Frankiaceae bacterium]|jgi:hypothetical protein|nr:hypothetical protein [Frankiaceae bacterium]
MKRRVVSPATAVILTLIALVSIPSAQAAPRGAACTLTGSATISPGLTQTAKSQSIRLSGVSLKNCRSGGATAPNTKVTTATITTSPNPVTTKASCASGNLALSATISWSTGQTTTATVTTKGVTANQTITGKVTSSTNPALAAGDTVAGDVAFKPTTTAQNCAKVPVTAVTFTGALVSGSPN